MNTGTDSCPFCGRTILKGAMRCLGCGKILQSAEDQALAIEKLVRKRRRFPFLSLLKITVIVLLAAIGYYYYGEQIMALIRKLTEK